MRVVRLFAAAALQLTAATAAAGQVSTDVPMPDPAYEALDRLRAEGWVRGVHMGQRPFSRLHFGEMAREARARLDSAGARTATRPAVEALALLESRFADEYAGTAGPGVAVHLREVRADAVWADSPDRSVPTAYDGASRIQARVNPLLDGDQGRRRVDGWTAGLEAAAEFRVGGRLAVYLRPRGRLVGPRGRGARTDGTLYEGYVRVGLGSLLVEAGRRHAFLGQGLGAAMVSGNARGLDGLRVSTGRPERMPGFLGSLGPTRASLSVSHLGSDRAVPGALLFLGKVSVRPAPGLELGVSWLNQQLGEGAPEATAGERLVDLLPLPFGGKEISERMVGFDARLTLPHPGLELYLDVASTDLSPMRLHESLWEEAAWVVGLRRSGLGPRGRVTVGVEGQRVGIRPYTHHDFVSGLTLDGQVIGSPLGPAATGWSVTVARRGTAHRAALVLAAEWYSADRYLTNGLDGVRTRWNRVTEAPDERRFRARLDWSWEPPGRRLDSTVRLGIERAQRFGFGRAGRTNAMLGVVLAHRP